MNEREMFERSFDRPRNYFQLPRNEQWMIDKMLGILDWEGKDLSDEDIKRFNDHYDDKEFREADYWNPTEDREFVISFDDQTGVDRCNQKMEEFVDELQRVAQKYDFDVSQFGEKEAMVDSFIKEREHIRKTLLNIFREMDKNG
jgi:hypothetical protein